MSARSPRPWFRTLAGALALAAAAGALVTLALAPRPGAFAEDERDYLRAASHLARHGVLAHAPLRPDAVPAADAYREPGYSFLLAAAWKVGRCEPPANEAELALAIAPGRCAARATRTLNLLLLATAMLGAAAAVRAAGAGAIAALVAGAAAGASPALRAAALGQFSENLAAAVVTCFSAALLLHLEGRAGALRVAILLAAIAPLARGSLVALPVAAALAVLLLDRCAGNDLRPRIGRATIVLLLALLPSALWTARNHHRTGHAVLAETRAVLLIRSELDRQIAGEGALAAALSWTPLDSAGVLRERLAPDATFERYEWSGGGNFFTRAMRRSREARASSSDPLAVDRSLARASLLEFVRHPLDHARATAAVAWRGLFAERSPRWLAPFDLTFLLGLALAFAWVRLGVLAVRERDVALLAFLLPSALLFAGHALLTEFLPRFALPTLPVAWAALVLAFTGTRERPATAR